MMRKSSSEKNMPFIISVAVFHTITYFVIGIIASNIFNYKELFALPIIANYFKPTESLSTYFGPLIQIIRGLLFGFVLLPFRQFFKNNKNGWCLLWLIFLVFGIINTSAVSPASIEGIIYTKLPLWFHLICIPEIAIQTLVFSLLVHRKLFPKNYQIPKCLTNIIEAFAITFISFLVYIFVSLIFAIFAKVDIKEVEVNINILGQFIISLLAIFAFAMTGTNKLILKHFILYMLSSLSIWIYGKTILGFVDLTYVILIPILPVIISFLLMNRKNKYFEKAI